MTDLELRTALDAAGIGTQYLTHPVTKKERWLTEGSVDAHKLADAIIAQHEAKHKAHTQLFNEVASRMTLGLLAQNSEIERLQQTSQEPVMFAFLHSDGTWNDASQTEHSVGMKPLYAALQPAVHPDKHAEIAALRQDKARLDWLHLQDLNSLSVGYVIDAPHDGEYALRLDSETSYGLTLRAAIDAAMAQTVRPNGATQ